MADEIKKIHAELSALRKEGKHDEASKYLASDAIVISPLHGPATKEEMKAMKASGKFDHLLKAQVEHTMDECKIIGDVAIDRGTIKIKKETGEIKNGNYLTVWVKEGGSWKIRNSAMVVQIELPK